MYNVCGYCCWEYAGAWLGLVAVFEFVLAFVAYFVFGGTVLCPLVTHSAFEWCCFA